MLATLCALVLALPLGTTWTVDDDGPADFPDIATAIAAAAPGDTLLVQPGTYAGFTLSKRLTILGPAAGPHPLVTGRSEVADVQRTELAGLALESLTLTAIHGTALVDDCILGPLPVLDGFAALQVVNCAQALVSRSTITGGQRTVEALTVSQSGLRAIGSQLVAVGCTITGGAGRDGLFGFNESGGNAGDGVVVRPGSVVTLVDCPAIAGGRTGECSGFVCTDGVAGDGIAVQPGGTVIVRGQLSNTIDAGGCYCTAPFFGMPGFAIDANSGTVVLSGASYGTIEPFGLDIDAGSVLLQPAVAEPFLALDGGLAAGDALTVRLHGPAGSTALLLASGQFGFSTLAKFHAPLWVEPASLLVLLPVTLAGQDTPVSIATTLPAIAGLEGLALPLQAAFPGVPDALDPATTLLGNPAPLVVRF